MSLLLVPLLLLLVSEATVVDEVLRAVPLHAHLGRLQGAAALQEEPARAHPGVEGGLTGGNRNQKIGLFPVSS